MEQDHPNLMTQERFGKLARGHFPFNPVSGEEISGMNFFRLKQGMDMFKWKDPRFLTKEQAELNGWEVKPNSSSITIFVRDVDYGTTSEVKVFNASNLSNIPSIEEMTKLNNDQLLVMQERGNAFEIREEFGDDVLIAPSKELRLVDDAGLGPENKNDIEQGKQAEVEVSGRYAVIAEYWRGGLHNTKGIALANRLNEEIKNRKLEEDEHAIKNLLDVNPESKRLGLKVVSEEEYDKNPHYKANVAEPKKLNGNMYVRDRFGAYRPKGGGKVVLQDNGESLQVKLRSKDSYKAAMELAKAKGWTAIELKGSKGMMPELWLTAKLMGLEVTNYKPTAKDIENFNKRIEIQTQEMAKDLQRKKMVVEQDIPVMDKHNQIEIIPIVEEPFVEQPTQEAVSFSSLDDNGESHTVTVTYEVRHDLSGQNVERFGNPKDAAEHFVKQPNFTMPTVAKVTTRADQSITETEIATTTEYRGKFRKFAKPNMDETFMHALEEAMIKEKMIPELNHKNKTFTGIILSVDHANKTVTQKFGPLHNDVVVHSMSKLNTEIKRDQNLRIEYDINGKVQKCKVIEREKSGLGISR